MDFVKIMEEYKSFKDLYYYICDFQAAEWFSLSIAISNVAIHVTIT